MKARSDPEPPQIDCPLCGEPIKQVSSATLSLALWQHVHWVCEKHGFPRDESLRLLRELYTLVWGECSSLLNEDSGGDANLDLQIRRVLAIDV